MGFVAFIFVFLLGGVVSLVGAAFAIYYFLIIYEKKTDAQRAKLALESSPEESQRATQLLIPELKTKVRFSFSTAPWPKEAAKRMQHTTIVLKANMFFHFIDERRDACSIARLDGCAVEVMRQGGKAKFNKKNYLKIVSPAGNLFPDAAASNKNVGDTCYIKFNNGKDLEQWYYALKSATSLTITKEPKEVELMQLQQRYFSHLTAVANNSSEVNADWANALMGRIFWGVHNHPKFLKLITEKLQKKMSKLKKPKFVESISVSDVGFGPNLPLFSNIKILSVSPQGSLAFDGDVYYHGGFNLMIDIMLRIDLPIGGVSVEVPIRASVVVKAFAGRGHIQVAPPPAKRAWIGFYGEPRVDLDVKIEVGKDLKLVNIPSIANIVINKIKQQLIKKLVLPAMDDWPLPHIPSSKAGEKAALPAGGDKEHAGPAALLPSAASGGITAPSLTQSPSVSSSALSRVAAGGPERTASSPGPSSSLSALASSSGPKRHSVAVLPNHAKPAQPIVVKTRTSPRDRVPSTREMVEHAASPAVVPPPLPARQTQSALSQALNQPPSHLPEAGSSQPYRPLTAYPGSGATAPPLPAREGTSTLASLQLPSSPPRGQWNSTDEWYQNSLLALRDRDDDSDTDGSDRESERAESERKEKERKENEEREKKDKEDKEKREREKEEREREEKERRDREREREQKEKEEQERREREARERKEDKIETEDIGNDKSRKDSEDISREIEQFTPIEKPKQDYNPFVDDEHKHEQVLAAEEERLKKEEEEKERRAREIKEQEEREERERKEKQRLEQEKEEERARRERELKPGQVVKQEVFTDPLSSGLDSPIIEEIFGSDDSAVTRPKRQSTYDPDRSSDMLIPDAARRRRSGSLNATSSSSPPSTPFLASSPPSSRPPALPPRAHELHQSPNQPMKSAPAKPRTTSQMFEGFDFTSAMPVPATSSTPASHSQPSSADSFLGLTTPAVGSTTPPSTRLSTSPSASSADSLFSFSSSTSSSSAAAPSSSAPAKPGKKGLFNLDMDELFNKVEKQHHLVEKFKAAKARAQNAIHDWNASGQGNQDL